MTTEHTANLDALDALYAAATPGHWRACQTCTKRGTGCKLVWRGDDAIIFASGAGEDIPCVGGPADAALAAALHEEYPAMAAELRALRAIQRDEAIHAAQRRASYAALGIDLDADETAEGPSGVLVPGMLDDAEDS